MACFEDFESDYDEDLTADYIPLPVGYQPGMKLQLFPEDPQNSSSDLCFTEGVGRTIEPAKVCNPGISTDTKLTNSDRHKLTKNIQTTWNKLHGIDILNLKTNSY